MGELSPVQGKPEKSKETRGQRQGVHRLKSITILPFFFVVDFFINVMLENLNLFNGEKFILHGTTANKKHKMERGKQRCRQSIALNDSFLWP